MPRYEMVTGPSQSDRAPAGVCELAIQAHNKDATQLQPRIADVVSEYVDQGVDIRAYEYDDPTEQNRLVMYTGTDRLDIATLRDLSEVYGIATEYEAGNIPPELSIAPTSRSGEDGRFFAWYEFKLEMELPTQSVRDQIQQELPNEEITPKNPIGDSMQAMVYRDANVANHRVKDVLNKSKIVMDSLPVGYIRIVCESKGGM